MIEIKIPELPTWPGETAVLLGGGPSLNPADISYCRSSNCRVICIHYTYRLAPWADLLYGTRGFWVEEHNALIFRGAKVTARLDTSAWKFWKPKPPDGVTHLGMLARTDKLPFINTKYPIWQGWGAGIQAIQITALCSVRTIALLGFDGRNNGSWHHAEIEKVAPHKFADHPEDHEMLALILAKHGVRVVNCTTDSAIKAYPTARLEEVV